jgi:hypothetical protein
VAGESVSLSADKAMALVAALVAGESVGSSGMEGDVFVAGGFFLPFGFAVGDFLFLTFGLALTLVLSKVDTDSSSCSLFLVSRVSALLVVTMIGFSNNYCSEQTKQQSTRTAVGGNLIRECELAHLFPITRPTELVASSSQRWSRLRQYG